MPSEHKTVHVKIEIDGKIKLDVEANGYSLVREYNGRHDDTLRVHYLHEQERI